MGLNKMWRFILKNIHSTSLFLFTSRTVSCSENVVCLIEGNKHSGGWEAGDCFYPVEVLVAIARAVTTKQAKSAINFQL
jgi:hypothetical protein